MSAIPITFVLPDLGGGGAQKVMLAVAGGLDRTRFSPRLLIAGGSQAFASHIPPHVPFENGGAKRLRDGMPWLVRRIRETRPAACISVMGYLNLMLLASRSFLPRETRLIIREANTIEATAAALPKWLPGRALYRGFYPRADAIVSPTPAIADSIAKLAPRAQPKLAVIPNPVDVVGLRARATPTKREPGTGLRLVSAGRLTRQKGYDRLLDLMTDLPGDARLTIFGEGEDRAALEAQARTLGIGDRVSFPGFSLDVARWIAGADVFVLPSRWEGLPNVVLESLALGTPAVVSDQAAAADLATEATPGAVAIRPVDKSFAEAIPHYRPAHAGADAPRPCLLPQIYEQAATIAKWSELLDRVLSHRMEQHV